jgi:hypothetical protein
MKRKFWIFFLIFIILVACTPTEKQTPVQIAILPKTPTEVLSPSINWSALTLTKYPPTYSKTSNILETVGPPSGTNLPVPTVTETYEVAFSPEFSKAYQPEFKVHYVAKIHEIEIPFDLGLMHSVITSQNIPIKEIHLSDDIVPILGEMYLRACFDRLKPPMTENWKLTYDQYIEMVKQGKGTISFSAYDERKNDAYPEVMAIDPRKGFSISLGDQPLPIKITDRTSMYYGSNGDGRLYIAENIEFIVNSLHDIEANFAPRPHDVFWGYILLNIIMSPVSDIAGTQNECFKYGDVQKSCDYTLGGDDLMMIELDFRRILDKIQNGQGIPIIEVVQ